MSNGEFNYTANKDHTYDAIVIGSGISGGWAAKELCEGGLKTLVLERGKNVVHLKDYPTATKNPWEFDHHGYNTLKIAKDNPVVSKCYAFDESTHHFFVKDKQHPYIQEKPFDWIRGYQVGGKSLLWARQTQRWSKFDFEGPARDNYAVDWPIRYDDLAPWYSHVETFAGISGNHDGLETLPDGEFLPPWQMNAVEKIIQKRIMDNYKDRNVIIGRCAHLTQPKEIHLEQGRGQCQARNLCQRGCPFGGYFSSNSSTLPTANKTGNLTIIPNSVVHSIIYDDKKEKATGVRVIDADTKQATVYYARIIFVNAATLNTNLILLNSKSARFPNGLGNDSGLLGKYVAFQNYRGYINATFDGPEDSYYYGRRPMAVRTFLPQTKKVRKPKSQEYALFPKTVGEHIRKIRIERGLLQSEVAAHIGVSDESIYFWENGRSIPQVQFYPAIIRFLGYYPFEHDTHTIAGKLQQLINCNGWSHQACALALGMDGSTVKRMLDGKSTMAAKMIIVLEWWSQLPDHLKQQHRPM